MSAQVSPIRAPRLTSNRLSDLEVAIESITDDAQYLEDAIAGQHLAPHLRERFTGKAASLRRAADWLRGKVDAERAQRGDA